MPTLDWIRKNVLARIVGVALASAVIVLFLSAFDEVWSAALPDLAEENILLLALAWIRDNPLISAIAAALTAAVIAWLRGAFDEILRTTLPSAASIACEVREASVASLSSYAGILVTVPEKGGGVSWR